MFNLSKDAAIKVAETTRLITRRPKFAAALPRTPVERHSAKHAKTTTTITARSGTILGTGTVELLTVVRPSGVPAYIPTGILVRVENMGATIAAGQFVQIKQIDGAYSIDTVYC